VLKCLGIGMRDGIALSDIKILQIEGGKPIIKVQGEVKRLSKIMGVKSWHISISHSINHSFAFVIAEGNNSDFI
jgi:holo-[acyl-carrier protein] synthase